MALVKCKECGNQVSNKAKNCPSCGAKVVKKVGIIGWLFVIVVVLPFAWSIGGNMGKVENHQAPQVKPAPTVAAPAESAKPQDKWLAFESKDGMTDQVKKILVIESLNSTDFEFPYKKPGGSHLTLTFRKTGKELDAYLNIDKGHMLCNYSNCNFSLRVGDGKVQSWTGLETSTNKSDMMFVRDARALEKIVKAGKPFRIGIEFYQSGTRAFEFDPSGYPGFK